MNAFFMAALMLLVGVVVSANTVLAQTVSPTPTTQPTMTPAPTQTQQVMPEGSPQTGFGGSR